MTSKVFSEAGYWYFWDEARTHRYGPFDTQEQAGVNLILYVYKLNGFPNVRVIEKYIHRLEKCIHRLEGTPGDKQMPLKEQAEASTPKYTTVEGHPIKVGKWYELGSGRKVEVVAIVPRRQRPIIAIPDGINPGVFIYTHNGSSNPTSPEDDIMRPCEAPDEHIDYPWKDFPLANWAMTDNCGNVYFSLYNERPTFRRDIGLWYCGCHKWRHPTYLREGADAATSLRKRPEGV